MTRRPSLEDLVSGAKNQRQNLRQFCQRFREQQGLRRGADDAPPREETRAANENCVEPRRAAESEIHVRTVRRTSVSSLRIEDQGLLSDASSLSSLGDSEGDVDYGSDGSVEPRALLVGYINCGVGLHLSTPSCG